MFGGWKRQVRGGLGLLGMAAVASGVAGGCSGKTQQSGRETPDAPTSGKSGASNVGGTSDATAGSGGTLVAAGGEAAGGTVAVAGAGGKVTASAGTAGGGQGGEPGDVELVPNEFPRPAICDEPRPALPPLLDSPSGCAAGCREVVGYPIDPGRGCIDTSEGKLVTCSCGTLKFGTTNSEECLKTKDGRRWLVVRGTELGFSSESSSADPPATYDSAVWSKCSEQDAETLRLAHNCDFDACVHGSVSHCGVTASNAGIWTLGCEHELRTFPAYDSKGCLKPTCNADAACAPDERCVRGVGVTPSCNFDSEGDCNCGASSSIDFDPAVCVDVATAGPRGPWERYRAHDLDRKVVWDLYPDGKLLITARGETKQTQVSAEDLTYFNQELNGYTIRAGMQNGFICPTTSGFPGNLTLVVAGITYARDLTGCFFDLPLTLALRQYGL